MEAHPSDIPMETAVATLLDAGLGGALHAIVGSLCPQPHVAEADVYRWLMRAQGGAVPYNFIHNVGGVAYATDNYRMHYGSVSGLLIDGVYAIGVDPTCNVVTHKVDAAIPTPDFAAAMPNIMDMEPRQLSDFKAYVRSGGRRTLAIDGGRHFDQQWVLEAVNGEDNPTVYVGGDNLAGYNQHGGWVICGLRD